MKYFLFFLLVIVVEKSIAQDKILLQKQLTEIMIDFPNKFKTLRDKKDSFQLKMRIEGTTDRGFMMINEQNTHWGYITSQLPIPHSTVQAKDLFDKWVEMINSITLNGAALRGEKCEPGLYGLYCYRWHFDNTKKNIAQAWRDFTIQISVLKINDDFAADLKIGDF
ncbi:MAG: hypothetical protein R2796_06545 [Chitinophagaceae bacterium]|nr:hypothetical protein [Chitinophagaceae bacterium]MCB0739949.1 hypothetical protein [Chitinophagaceae bacterium]HQU56127.1 hypothetical protein [Chitinophagaceae bacterium]HQV05760.1 hypothetical protein [Chitinophagaceae bacterium]